MLYGENFQFGGEKPYKMTDMRMGTLPIVAENIKVMGESLYVQGSGFTEKSKIFINGEKKSTIMLSQYSLMATGVTLTEGDSITVGQSSSKREVLSYSDPVIYSENEHFIASEEDLTQTNYPLRTSYFDLSAKFLNFYLTIAVCLIIIVE